MPHTRTAKKRLRQNVSRRQHNRYLKKGIKIQIKKFLSAMESGESAQIQSEFNLCAKKLDKAGARRIIHPNKAARKKSQLARLLREKTG